MKSLGTSRKISSIAPLFACSLLALFACRSSSPGSSSGPLQPSQVHFANGTDAFSIPFEVVDNNMYLTIKINDSVEVKVAFDSGFPLNGVLIIDSAVGAALGLTYVGYTPLGGAGDGSSVADVAQGATIALPGVSFDDQQVLVARDCRRYNKWLASGIIGGTILNSCVVEIDHEKTVLNLYRCNQFDGQGAGDALDITFSQGIPVMTATIEEKGKTVGKVKLLVDTGADVPFSLHSYDGLDLQPPEDAPSSYFSEGIKGAVHGKWSRLDAVRFGTLSMRNCIVLHPTDGFNEVKDIIGQNGFFGLDAQRRFKVTFDYIHSRMYLKPNSHFNDPFEMNMAGLVLRTLRNGLKEVEDVLPNSPGHAAGIRRGDLITMIAGRSSSSLSFIEMERMFTRENQSIHMSGIRGTTTFDTTLILRRVI